MTSPSVPDTDAGPAAGAPQRAQAPFSGRVSEVSVCGSFGVATLDEAVFGSRAAEIAVETSGRIMLLQSAAPKGRLRPGMPVGGIAEQRGGRLVAVRIETAEPAASSGAAGGQTEPAKAGDALRAARAAPPRSPSRAGSSRRSSPGRR